MVSRVGVRWMASSAAPEWNHAPSAALDDAYGCLAGWSRPSTGDVAAVVYKDGVDLMGWEK